GCARRRPGTDHRSGLFPADWRHRALAVPTGAQARRQTGTRLAVRLSIPAPEIRQHRQALRLRLRSACTRRTAVATRLHPGYRADVGRWNGMADFPACAADGTGITPGKPVNGV